MQVDLWLIWFIAAAIFILGEIFISGYFLLSLSLSCGFSGLLALFNINSTWQLAIFLVSAIVLTIYTRSFASQHSSNNMGELDNTNFIGKNAFVIETIDHIEGTGRVRIDKEVWLAKTANRKIVVQSTSVKVIDVDGAHLVVS